MNRGKFHEKQVKDNGCQISLFTHHYSAYRFYACCRLCNAFVSARLSFTLGMPGA